ncbi:MAG TPA: hypothetical protein VIJ50_04315 [Solirubrobacteraceae bacterium]
MLSISMPRRVGWFATLAVIVPFTAIAMLAPTQALALNSFCNRSLPAGATCELAAESFLGVVDAEVTEGSGNICVGADVSGTIHGESCANNHADSEPNVFGRPWLKNNSGKRLTLFGVYAE